MTNFPYGKNKIRSFTTFALLCVTSLLITKKRRENREMDRNIKLEDLNTIVGAKDNALIHSITHKICEKMDMYEVPDIKFSMVESCYRITFRWYNAVAISYIDVIYPAVSLALGRIKDFAYSPISSRNKQTYTTFSIDITTESNDESIPSIVEGIKTRSDTITLPRVRELDERNISERKLKRKKLSATTRNGI